jgi:hypothetical protein
VLLKQTEDSGREDWCGGEYPKLEFRQVKVRVHSEGFLVKVMQVTLKNNHLNLRIRCENKDEALRVTSEIIVRFSPYPAKQ